MSQIAEVVMSKACIQTTCPYCGVGCGVKASVENEATREITIAGDPSHPANLGRLCSKGSALADTVDTDARLLYPEVDHTRVGWDEALDRVASQFAAVAAKHGPDSVAFYVSGQLLTEDYYVANKLLKGFVGTANIDTNSRLCMSSAVAGHKRAFGADIVPGCYEDLEQAQLIILVGSNTAWAHPVLYQRIRKAKQDNPQLRVVVIDPRATSTCDEAELHLPLKPGTDAFLFNGLLHYLRSCGAIDYRFLEQHVEGFADAFAQAEATATDIDTVAEHCGLSSEQVHTFFQWFMETEQTVTAWCMGINQSSSGTDKVNAIINAHLATGRIGRPGMGPFSITGQPNAMGGREVGGLANMLAAHMDFAKPGHVELVERFWSAPQMATQPGLKAVELFEAVKAHKIKAIWIMATNPIVSMPDADQVKAALAECEFVVVSDCFKHIDTREFAHVLLPAQGWGEKNGTVTNSERRISRQRPIFNQPAGEAMPDWWIITQVAQRMGYQEAFDYHSAYDIFVEHAALSGYENYGERDFDISGLAELSAQEYDDLQPIQWPVNAAYPQGRQRFFDDGQFYTASGKAQFMPVTPQRPKNDLSAEYPMWLNTGRIRDQWHTMTRTGLSARLSDHIPEPYAELHPTDAQRLGLADKALCQIKSPWGYMYARVVISDDQQLGSVFIPMHWTAQLASHGRVDALVNPVTDPFSGEPEFKHTPVSVSAYQPGWHGFILSRRALDLTDCGVEYWVQVRGRQFFRYELAGDSMPEAWERWARGLLCEEQADVQWQEYADNSRQVYRAGRLQGSQLESCVFIAPHIDLPERNWLASLFVLDEITERDRVGLLTGRPGNGQADTGRVVCSCFSVGEKTITAAISEQGLTEVEQIGQCLKAGTNCGSCIPELRKLLAAQQVPVAS